MRDELKRMRKHLEQKPFNRAFRCLLKRETLEMGILPEWLTRVINWTVAK